MKTIGINGQHTHAFTIAMRIRSWGMCRGVSQIAGLALGASATAPLLPQLGDCDGVRVDVVCCENGEDRFTKQCIYVAGWTQFWHLCEVVPMPNCPSGQVP